MRSVALLIFFAFLSVSLAAPRQKREFEPQISPEVLKEIKKEDIPAIPEVIPSEAPKPIEPKEEAKKIIDGAPSVEPSLREEGDLEKPVKAPEPQEQITKAQEEGKVPEVLKESQPKDDLAATAEPKEDLKEKAPEEIKPLEEKPADSQKEEAKAEVVKTEEVKAEEVKADEPEVHKAALETSSPAQIEIGDQVGLEGRSDEEAKIPEDSSVEKAVETEKVKAPISLSEEESVPEKPVNSTTFVSKEPEVSSPVSEGTPKVEEVPASSEAPKAVE